MTTTEPARLVLPYPTPPLSLNHRHNRWQHAALTKQLRHDAWALAKQAKLGGPHPRVEVVLHWRPGRKGTYDEENPAPTLKACCDGLVDAGVVRDDDRKQMAKRIEIHDPERGRKAELWLTVAVLP